MKDKVKFKNLKSINKEVIAHVASGVSEHSDYYRRLYEVTLKQKLYNKYIINEKEQQILERVLVDPAAAKDLLKIGKKNSRIKQFIKEWFNLREIIEDAIQKNLKEGKPVNEEFLKNLPALSLQVSALKEETIPSAKSLDSTSLTYQRTVTKEPVLKTTFQLIKSNLMDEWEIYIAREYGDLLNDQEKTLVLDWKTTLSQTAVTIAKGQLVKKFEGVLTAEEKEKALAEETTVEAIVQMIVKARIRDAGVAENPGTITEFAEKTLLAITKVYVVKKFGDILSEEEKSQVLREETTIQEMIELIVKARTKGKKEFEDPKKKTQITGEVARAIGTIDPAGRSLVKDISDKIIREWVVWRHENVFKTVKMLEEASQTAYEVLYQTFNPQRADENIDAYNTRMKQWVDEKLQILFIYSFSEKNPGTSPDNQVIYDEFFNKGWKVNDRKAARVIVTPETTETAYDAKIQFWAFARPYVRGEVLLTVDWTHLVFPHQFFGLPFIVNKFNNKQLGILLPGLYITDNDITTTTREAKVAEDIWNNYIMQVKSRYNTVSFYGKGFFRTEALQDAAVYESIIEDTATGNEILKKQSPTGENYVSEFDHSIILGQAREKNLNYLPSFVARFGAPVYDDVRSVRFQQFIRDPNIPWTDKLGILFDFDFYLNKPFIMWLNILVFFSAYLLPFNIFAYLGFATFFINLSYAFTQSINSLALVNFETEEGFFRGYRKYVSRFWKLFFTYVPFIPLHHQKIKMAARGLVGMFTRGVKSTVYLKMSFKDRFEIFRPSIRWGVLLSIILLLSPYHPLGDIVNLFFVAFPIAFIWGPFMKDNPAWKGLLQGLLAIPYAIFIDVFLSRGLVENILLSKLKKHWKEREAHINNHAKLTKESKKLIIATVENKVLFNLRRNLLNREKI